MQPLALGLGLILVLRLLLMLRYYLHRLGLDVGRLLRLELGLLLAVFLPL